MIILDAVLMTLVGTGIVSLLAWSICTQYRHAGCQHLRMRRRLRISVRVVTLEKPEMLARTNSAV